jgi:hypothetical protein
MDGARPFRRRRPRTGTGLLLALLSPFPACGVVGGTPGSGDSAGGSADSAGGLTDGAGGSTATGECVAAIAHFGEPPAPLVMIVWQQSASMALPPASGAGTRWQLAHTGLLDPATGLVAKLQMVDWFGLLAFSGDSNQCPSFSAVTPALGNYPALLAALPEASATSFADGAPLAAAITRAANDLQAIESDAGKLLVLVTDGDATACGNETNADEQALRSVEAAYAQGLPTYVVDALGGGSLANMLANLGQGLPLESAAGRAYDPSDLQELTDWLIPVITATGQTCRLDLDGNVSSENAASGTVWLNGKPLVYGDADGWQQISPRAIELVGKACETLLESRSASLVVSFPCGVLMPLLPN